MRVASRNPTLLAVMEGCSMSLYVAHCPTLLGTPQVGKFVAVYIGEAQPGPTAYFRR